MQMTQINISCTTQCLHPAELHYNLIKNSPALAPPAFSSMAAKPDKSNCLGGSSPATGCPGLAPSPHPSLFSLSTGQQRALFQCNHRRTQTRWRCPPHGLLNNTGIRTSGKPTGFRQTALLASRFSFLIALPPFFFPSTLPSLHSPLSPRLPVLLKKFSFSLSCWNETNDKCSWRPPSTPPPPHTPPSKSIMKRNQYSAD